MTTKANLDVEAAFAEAATYDHVVILAVSEGQHHVKIISTVEYPPDILWALKSAELQLTYLGIDFDD